MQGHKSLPLQAHLQHLTAQECYNPYMVIESAFDDADLAEERRLLEDWLRCAFSRQRLSNEKRSLIPSLQLNLLRLLEAATLLAKKGESGVSPPPAGEVHHQKWFFRRRNPEQYACRYFPKYLRMQQQVNPYEVFKDCTQWLSLKNWEKLLDKMLAAANTKKLIYDITDNRKVYAYCHALLKLLEAAHLVYVREIQQPFDATTPVRD